MGLKPPPPAIGVAGSEMVAGVTMVTLSRLGVTSARGASAMLHGMVHPATCTVEVRGGGGVLAPGQTGQPWLGPRRCGRPHSPISRPAL